MILTGIENMIALVIAKIRAYRTTTVADSGSIRNEQITKAFYAFNEKNQMPTTVLAIIAGSGAKFRTSTIYSFFTKLYSMYLTNDAAQATDLNQPYLAGNIAPNERFAMLNISGMTKSMTHPALTYTATDPWSITFVVQPQCAGTALQHLIGKSNDTSSIIGFRETSNLMAVKFINESGTVYNFTNNNLSIIGKKTVFTLTADGAGNLSLYRNGALIQTIAAVTSFVTSAIIKANSAATLPFFGRYYYHVVRNGYLTAAQALSEYTFCRSIYPEIAAVQIGSQEWATSNLDVVCTPQGNVINEITDNANVELITGGDMESGLAIQKVDESGSASTLTLNTTSPISGTQDARLVITTGNASRPIVRANNFASITAAVGKYYKLSFAYKVNSGSPIIQGYYNGSGVTAINQTLSGTGTFSVIFKALGVSSLSTIYMGNAVCDMQMDNYSLQQVGWSGLTEVYDAVYAATAGTAAVKDTAGCLAAAAWCYYNNDSANGAIYGKLYNWYAARTLQYDIDAYNTANPTTPWGYKVPSQADFTTLQTTLGGSAVAGGKMKKEGLSYWTTPNTGSNNASGFSAIGGGNRWNVSGAFSSITIDIRFWAYNGASPASCTFYRLTNNSASFDTNVSQNAREGNSIRLIKG